MKKNLVFNILTIIGLTTSLSPKATPAKASPLKGDFYIRVIDKNLLESSEGGMFVDEIKTSGEDARNIIKHLHSLSKSKSKKDLVKLHKQLADKDILEKAYHRHIKIQADCEKDEYESDVSTTRTITMLSDENDATKEIDPKVDVAVHTPADKKNEEDLKSEILMVLKYKMIAPRDEFFKDLHDFGSIIRSPLSKSLRNCKSKEISEENSLLMSFLHSNDVDTYFDKTVDDEHKLKLACSELVIFCRDLWGALSQDLMHKRVKWLEAQEASKEATE